MKKLTIYPEAKSATFITRPNRFVMELKLKNKIIKAYMPNTGRMVEFLHPGNTFYVIKKKSPKFNYRVVATKYQQSYVFLDTVKINSVFEKLLHLNLIDELKNLKNIEAEKTFGNSRFDFYVTTQQNKKVIIEVKSVTLCHNQIAMFPDAATIRGRKHIKELNKLTSQNYKTYIYYLILNKNCHKFYPNFHTDINYCNSFLAADKVNYRALQLNFTNPVTINLEKLTDIPIDKKIVKENTVNKGTYILILENNKDFYKQIGALGKIYFQSGYYLYIGSALNSLNTRLRRHSRKNKKTHWHIDYIIPANMKILKKIVIRRTDYIEESITKDFIKLTQTIIKGFGSTDSKAPSHLLYFKKNPFKTKQFWKIILNYETFTENK